jgi:ABC-type branched-subunit amino acid transport system ATPase component/ABC-type branched-subunit amino acid transport system permease subunit
MITALAYAPEYLFRGAIIGMTYGLLALGIVLVFRSSSILNFAHGEIGIFAAGIFTVIVNRWSIPYWLGFAIALIIGAAAGVLAEVIIVRRLRRAPKLMSVVATLGFASFLNFFGNVIQGPDSAILGFPKPSGFPTFKFRTFFVGPAHSAILILSPIVMIAIAVFLRSTRVGIGIRAASANPEAARMAGLSPSRMSAIAWGLAGALSAYTSVLVTPALGFGATAATNAPGLLLRALTVAIIARMTSIPITLLAGLIVGVVESFLQFNYSSGGPIEVLLLATALIALLLQSGRRGRSAQRDSWIAVQPWAPLTAAQLRNPATRNLGRAVGALGLLGAVLFGLFASNQAAREGGLLLRMSLIGLSLFFLIGLAGQLSLGQFAIAAIGAVVAVRVAAGAGDMITSIIAAGVAGAVVSALLGIPALRVRGLMLAVTTLGFAVATQAWLLGQPWVIGDGLDSTTRRIFGIDLSTDRRYYWLILAILVITFLAVRNLSASGYGRRLRALRDNEDQARAFSVSAVRTLLGAYAVAGFIAGVGGAVYAHSISRVSVQSFAVADSVNVTALAVLGGLGIVAGPLLGALYVIGLPRLPLDSLALAASSLGWLVLLLYVPSGIAGLIAPLRAALLRALGGGAAAADDAPGVSTGDAFVGTTKSFARAAVPAATVAAGDDVVLRVTDISKRFGGVTACNAVSFDVRRGETLGLIGPNGAGKTTLFEIIGGFTKADGGQILFNGDDVTARSAEARAQAGLIRSFQDAPLFPTLSVIDTIRLAHERRMPSGLFSSLVGRAKHERVIRAETDRLIEMLGLQSYARKAVHELSTGTRRITELACLVALEPMVLLLDEPSSGVAQRETEALGDLIRAIKSHLGTTVVIIEHDIPLVRGLSDRLVAMESGMLIAVGTPAAVLADPLVVSSYLGGSDVAIERSGVGA